MNIVNFASIVTVGLGSSALSGAGAVRLFRAVEPGELADILAQGVFRNPFGIEAKYFARTAKGAAHEAQMLSRLGAGPFTIVETSIPRGALEALPAGNILAVDGGVSTVVLGSEELSLLSAPKVLPFIPLP